MRRYSFPILLHALLALSACESPDVSTGPAAAVGILVSDEQLYRFRYGTTNSFEVRQVLGEPQASSFSAPESLLLVYLFMQPRAGLIEQVTFQFERDVLRVVQRTQIGAAARPLPACLATPSRSTGI